MPTLLRKTRIDTRDGKYFCPFDFPPFVSRPTFARFFLRCALVCKILSMSTQSLFFGVMSSDDGDGSDEAAEFYNYVTSTFPATADRWILYDTESDFEDVITASSYSQESPSDDVIGLSAGIVFSSGSPAWAYTVRRTERVLPM